MLKVELKYACRKDAEMYDPVSTEYSTLRKALCFVGWEFLMAFGCLNLLKNLAINTSISSFFSL